MSVLICNLSGMVGSSSTYPLADAPNYVFRVNGEFIDAGLVVNGRFTISYPFLTLNQGINYISLECPNAYGNSSHARKFRLYDIRTPTEFVKSNDKQNIFICGGSTSNPDDVLLGDYKTMMPGFDVLEDPTIILLYVTQNTTSIRIWDGRKDQFTNYMNNN